MASERIIGLVGCGAMGSGIAQAAAMAGFIVQAVDAHGDAVRRTFAAIAERLDREVAEGRMPRHRCEEVVSRLEAARSVDDLRQAECVFEAVPDELTVKRGVLRKIEDAAPPDILLVTSASQVPIRDLAAGLKHGERLVGMHFLAPELIGAVTELVAGPTTAEATMVEARALCGKLGAVPIRVNDTPGFVANRVSRPFHLEAAQLLESGEADIRSVDQAVEDEGGMAVGPFRRQDRVGLDVDLRVTTAVYEGFGRAPRFAPNPIQDKLVAAGHWGTKVGRGFYDYTNGQPTAAYEVPPKRLGRWRPSRALGELAEAIQKPADRALWIYARVLLGVVNEAALAAETVARPRDVDTVMQFALAASDGPLAMADRIGLDVVQRLLAEFYGESGRDERFKANLLLDRHVAEGRLGEKTARGFLHHAL